MISSKEIEVRFLDIDKPALEQKLLAAGAVDLGEVLISEIAFYDQKLDWMTKQLKVLRLRSMRGKNYLTFKHSIELNATGTTEIEVEVSDFDKTKEILEVIGLVAYRELEKRRHTFKFNDITVDIDTWPTLPPLVEFEGPTEDQLKEVTNQLGFDWTKAVFEPSIIYLETIYDIPIKRVRVFTFNKIVKE